MKKLIILASMVISLLILGGDTVEASTLTQRQQEHADAIAAVAIENYDTYRILPSVAVTQACNESSLGKNCVRMYNCWGIKIGNGSSSYRSYSSLYNGTIDYLTILQNTQYYKGLRSTKNFYTQLSRILRGGYCDPPGRYYQNCVYLYERYNFGKYDQQLWNKIAKEKRLERIKREKERRRKERERKRRERLEQIREESESKLEEFKPLLEYNHHTIVRSGSISVITNDENVMNVVNESENVSFTIHPKYHEIQPVSRIVEEEPKPSFF